MWPHCWQVQLFSVGCSVSSEQRAVGAAVGSSLLHVNKRMQTGSTPELSVLHQIISAALYWQNMNNRGLKLQILLIQPDRSLAHTLTSPLFYLLVSREMPGPGNALFSIDSWEKRNILQFRDKSVREIKHWPDQKSSRMGVWHGFSLLLLL